MRKKDKLLISGVAAVVVGWLSIGFAYTVKLGPPPINTIIFCAGPILFILGIILIIIGVITKLYRK